MQSIPSRPRSTLLTMLLLWVAFYASFTLFSPPLLDDADSVHAEVAREMLLRHDYVTLYANGIRYLEKAPLLYWSMAASMRVAMLFGAASPRALAAACRFPLSLTVLALAWLVETLARRMFASTRAGLYAALITLSSFGIFLFTRTMLPDADVCLWLSLALLAFWNTEQQAKPTRRHSILFAVACALNVLSKGLIGLVFPIGIVLVYLLFTRGAKSTWQRLRELHTGLALLVFLAVAAPWHLLAGLANPGHGHPAPFLYAAGHWQVPLPTDGNVRGWTWFYFMNEHLLRYLNLRVPHDYDTAPLWLFWGLCLVWLMPWSAFLFQAAAEPLQQWIAAIRVRLTAPRRGLDLYSPAPDRATTLLVIWAALPLFFFSLSTRQEYYVLPAIPAFALLIGGWLASARDDSHAHMYPRKGMTATIVLVSVGGLLAVAICWFLLHTKAPAPNTDLARLLTQNASDYTLSMGHFMDINAQAAGMFRVPLALATISVFICPLASLVLRRRGRAHAATLALAAGAFLFLLVVHLGLQTFAPVLTSAQLATQIAPQVHPEDMVAIHGEYESGSTLGFYLQRSDIHIVEGRSSNLWYGSFFPDAPKIFETPESFAAKWRGPQRIFLWQATSLPDAPKPLTNLPGPVYIVASGGGKEILSNEPNQ